MKIAFNLILIVIGTFYSCSSNTSNDVPSPSSVIINVPDSFEIAINYVTGAEHKVWISESFILEIFGQLECREDDIFTFFSNGTYEYDGGILLCGDSDSKKIKTGIWELDLKNRQIRFDRGTANEATAELITLGESEIQARGSWSGFSIDAKFKSVN